MIFGGLRLQKTDMIDGLVVVRPHGGLDRRVVAVLLHEEVGAAPDVAIRNHFCWTSFTAASASAPVMSGRARWTA